METSPNTPTGDWNPDQLTFWSEGRPAKPFPSQDCERDSTTLEGSSLSSISNWLRDSNLNGSSGKMSPVSCQRTEEGHLAVSSGRWRNSGTGSPTECWTLATSESPSAGGASSLLRDVLETGRVAPRYFLSRKACAGILRRAEKRGKTLPPMLGDALRAVASSTEDPTSG